VLHLTPGQSRAAGLGGYAAIVVAAAAVYGTLGARPFSSDASLLQRATALLFVGAGASAYRLPGLASPVRALLATDGAWLAVDEWAMIHECLKFGALARLTSGAGRDAVVLGYALVGAVVAAWVASRVRPPREALAHGVLATLAVGGALLIDVAGVIRGPLAEVLEETAEQVAAWGAIQCCAAAARRGPSASWREALAVGAWSAAWLGAVAWLLKPLFCPARFL